MQPATIPQEKGTETGGAQNMGSASGSDVILSLRLTPALVSSSLSATTNGCNMRIIKWHGVSHEGFTQCSPNPKMYTHISFSSQIMR